MESVEQLVKKYDFFRIHAAFIVNEEHIENLSNDGLVTMKNKKVITISKRRMANFKDSYMKFIRRRITQNEHY